MTKELGEVTLRELAEECKHNEDCCTCPFEKTKLNCWGAYKMLKDDLLETEVEL